MALLFFTLFTYFILNILIFRFDKTKYDSVYYVGVNENLNKIVVFFKYLIAAPLCYNSYKRDIYILDFILYHYYQASIMKADIGYIFKKHLK